MSPLSSESEKRENRAFRIHEFYEPQQRSSRPKPRTKSRNSQFLLASTPRFSSNKVLVANSLNARHCFLPRGGRHGVVVERRSTRADPAAQVRQRQFRATIELVGAAFGALGDAHSSAGSGRGQGHRGAAPGAPGQALTDLATVPGFRRGRGNLLHVPSSPTTKRDPTTGDLESSSNFLSLYRAFFEVSVEL